MSQFDETPLTPEEKWEKATIAKNSGQAFNLEMQAADSLELPERARYYQGSIDVDCLKSGEKYKELKDSYVIFICIQDIFEKGLTCYS